MKKFILAGMFTLLMTGPGLAAVTVLGSTEGQDCYFAARSPFGTSGIGACDQALRSGTLDKSETAGTHVNRGILYMRSRDFERAFADFEKALQIVPGMPEAFVNRGNVYFHRGEFNAALADYTAAINGDTKQLFAAYYNRGLAYERLGQKDKAIEDFKTANTLNPDWQEPRDKLAQYGVTPVAAQQ